jgi:hypothetical protein
MVAIFVFFVNEEPLISFVKPSLQIGLDHFVGSASTV